MPYQDVMNVILPKQGNHSAHITGHYGEHRAKGPHGGSDFNYEGGQAGVNLTHPELHSPIAGEVTFVGGQYGTIKIRDAEGNSHEILHTQSQSVKVGQHVQVGDAIGHMGGRGPDGATQYAQHVHYQMKDAHGRPVNPETFWRDREVGHVSHAAPATARTHAEAPHVVREGDHGASVRALQENLNALGVRDERGRPLSPDGHFGAHTKEAVENFQRAHGLPADGIVGPRTTEALQKAQTHGAPRLDDASHPGHEIYRQAREGVHRLDAQHQRTPDHNSERLAASLTVAAKQEGLHRIDHVALNEDATRTYAVQGDPQSPFKQVAEVNTQQAMATSVEESSRAWQQVAQQAPNTAHQQQQAQQQQQAAPTLPGAGP
ncbi:XVIPCD domain-containing protein [Luteibacter sp. UNCMF366Tsu5.1]|uniref:XVIPCD domain-containing protein n=1 Tax=Luteibacter sp. UNCMF366Tsu5.1 TaxID=1502758 RepID=UPI00090902FA|nr:XVIPCD domain-containing protein [Luteibacter sp. UNCMF366Tsu5.1]SFW62854.1 Peptidase family M23 [Luteibacter sp. UNCMF366Tsu5.1]